MGKLSWTYQECECHLVSLLPCDDCIATNGIASACPGSLCSNTSLDPPQTATVITVEDAVGLNELDLIYCKSCARVLSQKNNVPEQPEPQTAVGEPPQWI